MPLRKLKLFVSNYPGPITMWLLIGLPVAAGFSFGIDEHVLGAIVLLVGILGHVFAALVAWIGFVPLVGRIIAKILALPFIWILNGIGYLASAIAIKRGYTKDVLNHGIITLPCLAG